MQSCATLAEGLKAAEARRKAVADRVRVVTPDPYVNAAVPAICSAADGIWDPPVYVHDGVAHPVLGLVRGVRRQRVRLA